MFMGKMYKEKIVPSMSFVENAMNFIIEENKLLWHKWNFKLPILKRPNGDLMLTSELT
jgi:hypothetical protein